MLTAVSAGAEMSGAPGIVCQQAMRDINSVSTQVMTHGYSDRIFIVVTQCGRIGSLVR